MTHHRGPHPCGNLPVYGLMISAWHCPWHQSTWWNAYTYRETGADMIETTWQFMDECGPLINDRELVLNTLARGLDQWDKLITPS